MSLFIYYIKALIKPYIFFLKNLNFSNNTPLTSNTIELEIWI